MVLFYAFIANNWKNEAVFLKYISIEIFPNNSFMCEKNSMTSGTLRKQTCHTTKMAFGNQAYHFHLIYM